MRQSFTAVVERNVRFDAEFTTEPYEAAWANEARWFVRVLEATGDSAKLEIHPQISPDGLFWCDEGSTSLVVHSPGLYSFALRDFGGWLRLHGDVHGESGSFKVIIYVVLKG
jgi:hypothetical protein